ncbi:putative E3 ubiquitin-protein ligase LIN [Tanacetum coccineum]
MVGKALRSEPERCKPNARDTSFGWHSLKLHIRVWNASNYNLVQSVSLASEVRTMVISSDMIYMGCKGGTVEVWCRKKLTRKETLQTGTNCRVICMALDSNEDLLVVGTSDGRIQAWGSVKNLVFSGHDAPYIYFVEINAPYILSLTIKAYLPLEKLLLRNVSSVIKAELDYYKAVLDDESLEMHDELKEEMLKGLLFSLGHAKEVKIGELCLEALTGLKAKGFICPSNLKVLDKINVLEKRILEGKLVLVDDDGKPLEKLEQWRESNVDDDYDPYDDDMYEGQEIPDNYSFALSRLEAKGFISPSNLKVVNRISPISSYSDSDRDSNESGDSDGDSVELWLDDGVEVEGGLLIDITNKSIKNLVFSGYDAPYIYFVEINALLCSQEDMVFFGALKVIEKRSICFCASCLRLEKLLLLNVYSVTEVKLDYYKALFDDESLETYDQLKEDMIEGLLLSLGHVKEVIIGSLWFKAKGFIYPSNLKVLGEIDLS